MKKHIISTAVVLTAIASTFAQSTQGVQARGTFARPMGASTSMPTTGAPAMMPLITTGDPATDTKIKTLQTEMETKIKAIRDEYQAKIKVLVGDKKVNSGNDMMNRGSSTMRTGMRDASSTRMEDRDERRGTSTMMHRDGEMMNGSGTPEGGRPTMMNHEGTQVPSGRQVKGESTEGGSEKGVSTQTGIRGFFSKFFGR